MRKVIAIVIRNREGIFVHWYREMDHNGRIEEHARGTVSWSNARDRWNFWEDHHGDGVELRGVVGGSDRVLDWISEVVC